MNAKVRLLLAYVGEDTLLLEVTDDRKVVELCSTQDHHRLLVHDDRIISVPGIDESKVHVQFGDEWTYEDCWAWVAEHGFDEFVKQFSHSGSAEEVKPAGAV